MKACIISRFPNCEFILHQCFKVKLRTILASATTDPVESVDKTSENEVSSKKSDTVAEIQAQESLAETAKEAETCVLFAADLRTVRESLNKITEYAKRLQESLQYLPVPIAEQELTRNTLLNLSEIVLDSSIIPLTGQRRRRLRELILKTTKNLETIAKLNYDFCQQLENISLYFMQQI
ncbi:unnamed protein product [Hydatigera taeniaeformis]|uniref:BAG domain-containing protein n=1 Tax=Hydatigena taeniaeformis TaxID=6205 RepID=A0A0R3WZD8_HYDTA|nr:unnamed protein product [Hydatigera taeniaeformis]